MRNTKHTLKCALCIVLTTLMLLSTVLCVNAVENADVAQTGAATTVYFKNTSNWGSVTAYCWIQGTETSIQSWPGQSMTLYKDNVYKYTITGDYNMIIFSNNGSSQTTDLSVAGDGYIYDYSTGSWSVYSEHVAGGTTSTDATTATTTPTTTPDTGDTTLVYCRNTAGWSSVTCYMWSDSLGNNGGWPGKSMKNIGENVWQYEVEAAYTMIIFSNSGQSQTSDLTFPGHGYIYDNSTGKWEVYDTSPITVKSTGSDLASPQYKGTDIVLTADATSTGGTVSYKFSVSNGSTTTVISNYSTANTATWTPTATGTYTITYDFKDAAGNENQRTATYEIKDDTGVENPILKGVTPKPGQIKKGTQITFTANASGGNVETKLLFYKYTVKNAAGEIVNVPYYTKSKTYNFTPSALGTYTLTVSVQSSNNELIERTYTYTSVTSLDPTTPTETTPVTPTTPVANLKGDADGDSVVTVLDVTAIQRYCAQLITDADINYANANVNSEDELNIIDATMIQRYLAQYELNW